MKMQTILSSLRDPRPRFRRLAALAAVGAALTVAWLPAHALSLRLDWKLDFAYPPNPCVAGSALATSAFGLYGKDDSHRDVYSLWIPNPGPPDIACGASALSGSGLFEAADGTAIFGAWAGAVHQNPGPPDMPAYAFPPGTAEGDRIVEFDPGAAPFVALCNVVAGSIECPNPGPPDLPLFAFASPGHQVGTLTLLLTPVPEPASAALLIAGLGALAALGRRRRTAAAA